MTENKRNGRFSVFLVERTAEYIFATYIIPILGPIVGGLIGVRAGVSWFYIYIGMFVLLAATLHFLNQFYDWREKNKVKDRLWFDSLEIVPIIDADGISARINLQSTAPFPTFFSPLEYRVVLSGRTPESIGALGYQALIPTYGKGYADSGIIPGVTAKERAGKTMNGSLDAVIKYGKESKLVYELPINKTFIVSFDMNGNFVSMALYDKTKART